MKFTEEEIRKGLREGVVTKRFVPVFCGSAIKNIGSKSMLLPTNGMLVKKCLALLGNMGIELLYKEQYEIADENYLVDIEHTMNDLYWQPEFDDTDMLYQAYEYYQQEKAGKKV